MQRVVAVAAAGLALSAGTAAHAKPVASVMSETVGPIAVEEVASGLKHLWALEILPDGRMLVTEKATGALLVVQQDGSLSEPLKGLPPTFNQGQGGLLDVALHPDFEQSGMVYLSYSEPGDGAKAGTALGRGKLEDGKIIGFETIFRQEPKVEGPNHFGGRIVFSEDGHLFLTLGERFKFDPAQDPSNHLGKVVRLTLEGEPAEGNPFVGEDKGAAAVWSYGHRNIEAAAINPEDGSLWIAEMGPMGGDELNKPEAGKNYGWPVVSWGNHYSGEKIPDPTTRPEFADAEMHWTPVISPSGMEFYKGSMFPEWQNSALIWGLSGAAVVRVVPGEGEVERIPLEARIRDVVEAPDGSVLVLTDQRDGKIWRLRSMKDG